MTEEIKQIKRSQSISGLVIVKNEEFNIKNCIDSIKDIVDEIIIVDTGSSDKTKEVIDSIKILDHSQMVPSSVEMMNGKTIIGELMPKNISNRIIKYHKIPWKQDFSEVRNFGIIQCQYNWILMLDGDETLEPSTIPSLFDCINTKDMSKVKPVAIRIRSYKSSDNSPIDKTQDKDINFSNSLIYDQFKIRLFPNLRGLCFSGKVYEQLYYNGNMINPRYNSKIQINHFGYFYQDDWKRKIQRNKMIFLSQPIIRNIPYIFNLIEIKFYENDFGGILKIFLDIQGLLTSNDLCINQLLSYLFESLYNMKQYELLLQIFLEYLDSDKNIKIDQIPGILYFVSLSYIKQKKLYYSKYWFKKFMELKNKSVQDIFYINDPTLYGGKQEILSQLIRLLEEKEKKQVKKELNIGGLRIGDNQK